MAAYTAWDALNARSTIMVAQLCFVLRPSYYYNLTDNCTNIYYSFDSSYCYSYYPYCF